MNDNINDVDFSVRCPDGVFIVKYYDIYDYDHHEFIMGVGSSRDHALNIIKSQIKDIASSYSCCRFSIEHWYLNEVHWVGRTESFSKEQNIEWAKELGVYYD